MSSEPSTRWLQTNLHGCETMAEIQYTEEEFAAFKRLVVLGESQDQMDRIDSRLAFPDFIKATGKAKCDVMFERLKLE